MGEITKTSTAGLARAVFIEANRISFRLRDRIL
jgi:hypothetical protein